MQICTSSFHILAFLMHWASFAICPSKKLRGTEDCQESIRKTNNSVQYLFYFDRTWTAAVIIGIAINGIAITGIAIIGIAIISIAIIGNITIGIHIKQFGVAVIRKE